MLEKNYNLLKIIDSLKAIAISDPKKKGQYKATPNDLGNCNSLRAFSVEKQSNKVLIKISFHEYPHRYFTVDEPLETLNKWLKIMELIYIGNKPQVSKSLLDDEFYEEEAIVKADGKIYDKNGKELF